MRYKDFCKEHNLLPSQTFKKPDLAESSPVGTLRLKTGEFADVLQKTQQNFIQLIASLNEEILGFITLVIIPDRKNIAMVKNAQSYIKGQGVALNLIMFAKHKLGIRLISDYEMTSDGEATWQAMAKKPELGVKIYNFDLDKIYDLNDPTAIKPEHDQNYQDENKINWFYIIESNNKFPSIKNNSLVFQYYYEI